MRDKWDSRRGGTTYGAQTIERAIAGCAEFYRPRGRRADRPSHQRTDKNTCSIATRRGRRGVSDDPVDEPGTTEGAPSVEGWHVDGRGRLWVADAEGELRYTVTASGRSTATCC